MQVEYRLLRLLGANFREQVVSLKRQGIKTELAFAILLGLESQDGRGFTAPFDPYQALLDLEERSDAELLRLFPKED